MIKFSKSSWHRRIVDWGMGKSYLAWRDYEKKKWDDKAINLCPYMRVLVAVIIVSPWIAFWQILPKYCTWYHPDATKIFLIIGSICSIIHVVGTQELGFEWWYVPVGISFITLVVMLLAGIVLGAMALSDYLKGRPRSEKSSLIREYMKAKHNKVCPQIEFDEEVKE